MGELWVALVLNGWVMSSTGLKCVGWQGFEWTHLAWYTDKWLVRVNIPVQFWVDSSGLVHGQVAGPCEHSGAVLIAQKYRAFLDRPTNCLSLKDSVILHFLSFLHFLILFPVILFPCRCAFVISVYSVLQISSFCFSFFPLRNFLSMYRAN